MIILFLIVTISIFKHRIIFSILFLKKKNVLCVFLHNKKMRWLLHIYNNNNNIEHSYLEHMRREISSDGTLQNKIWLFNHYFWLPRHRRLLLKWHGAVGCQKECVMITDWLEGWEKNFLRIIEQFFLTYNMLTLHECIHII